MTPVRRPRPQQPKSSRCGPSGGRPLPTKQRHLYLLPAVGNQVVKVRSATWAAKKNTTECDFQEKSSGTRGVSRLPTAEG